MGWHINDRGPSFSLNPRSPKCRHYATPRQRTLMRRAAKACLHPRSQRIHTSYGHDCAYCGKQTWTK